MISVGSVIGGRFRIDRILGAGGMGIVLAATHLELGHRVAIKLLRDEMATSPAIVERFLREARAVVGLRTEHVCRVIDVGRLDTGAPYIVMEMLEGVDLQRSVATSALPLTTAVEYILQACVAIAEAHAAGIIHRDLKPANLFVTRRFDGGPLVKVLDFGIAKALTESGAHLTHQSAMGSPGYMSPEQIQSARDVDVRTDIWALGVTLYQLLSARLPFPGTNPTEIAITVANEPPAPLEVDPALRAVVWKCLEKDPDRRYHSIGELMTALAPFGGPNARTFLGQAAQLGGDTGGFSPVRSPATEPLVSTTQATLDATAGPSVRVPVVPTEHAELSERAPKRRWPVMVALLVVVGVGGAIGGVMYMQHAQPVAIVAPVPAVVVVAPIDAAPDAVTSVDAGDPWAEHDDPLTAAADDEPSVELPTKKQDPSDVMSDLARATKMQKLVMQCRSTIEKGTPDMVKFLACICKQPGAKDLPELKGQCEKM